MSTKNILFIFAVCSLLSVICYSQWQPDVRLTNAPGSSYSSHNSIAVAGDIIHVAWEDDRDGNREIYYKASGDGGLTWSSDARLTNNSAISGSPSIAVSGPDVHVVWFDERNGNTDIYYKRSVNGGFSWSSDIRLTTNSSNQFSPTISVTGQILHLAWEDQRNGGNGQEEIYYKASGDGGLTWSADARMSNASGYSSLPDIVVSGPDVHLVWSDPRDGNYEIYYRRSINGGFSWGNETRLTFDPGGSSAPSITAAGSIVHMAWYDTRDGNGEIYYKASGDGGVNWSPDGRLTNDVSLSLYPNIFVLGPYVHVVWHDNRSGNYEIYHKLSLNGGFTWPQTDTRLTNSPGTSQLASVAAFDSKVHVVWTDNRDGNYEVYYKRNGNFVGIANINPEVPDKFSLSQNYPNPFNPVTNIKFSIPASSFVKLIVYDITGRMVANPVNQQMNAGTYEVDFDASELSSGVYFYKLDAKNFSSTKKMNLIK